MKNEVYCKDCVNLIGDPQYPQACSCREFFPSKKSPITGEIANYYTCACPINKNKDFKCKDFVKKILKRKRRWFK